MCLALENEGEEDEKAGKVGEREEAGEDGRREGGGGEGWKGEEERAGVEKRD